MSKERGIHEWQLSLSPCARIGAVFFRKGSASDRCLFSVSLSPSTCDSLMCRHFKGGGPLIFTLLICIYLTDADKQHCVYIVETL